MYVRLTLNKPPFTYMLSSGQNPDASDHILTESESRSLDVRDAEEASALLDRVGARVYDTSTVAFLKAEEAKIIANRGEGRRVELRAERERLLSEIEGVRSRLATIDGVLSARHVDPSLMSETYYDECRDMNDAVRIIRDQRLALSSATYDRRVTHFLRANGNAKMNTKPISTLLHDKHATVQGVLRLVPENIRPRVITMRKGFPSVVILQPHEGGDHGLLLKDIGGTSDFCVSFRLPEANGLPQAHLITKHFDCMCMCCTLAADSNTVSALEKEYKAALSDQIAAAADEAGISALLAGHGGSIGGQYRVPGVTFISVSRGSFRDGVQRAFGDSSLLELIYGING